MLLQTMFIRVKSFLPKSWFPNPSPIVDSFLMGFAKIGEIVKTSIDEVVPQLRIKTATGGVLDLIANDMFGSSLLRSFNESDSDYRLRILIELFRERATYPAMMESIAYFTGFYPVIVESGKDIDATGYVLSEGSISTNEGDGYGVVVRSFHCFISIYIPYSSEYANVAGYGVSTSGYSVFSRGEYVHSKELDINSLLQIINTVRPVSTKIWVKTIQDTYNNILNLHGALPYDLPKTLSGEHRGLFIDRNNTSITE